MKIETDETIFLEGDELLNHPKLVAAIKDAARQIKDLELQAPIKQLETKPQTPKKVSILTVIRGLATGILGIS